MQPPNRIKAARQKIAEREDNIMADLTRPTSVKAWKKIKLKLLEDLILRFKQNLTNDEKDALLAVKADRKALEKELGFGKLRWGLRRIGNLIRKPFLQARHEKLDAANLAKLSYDFQTLGVKVSPERLQNTIAYGENRLKKQ